MLGGGSTGSATPAQPRQQPAGGPQPVRVESRPKVQPVTRQSPGLEQFFGTVRDRRRLAIIDLAGVSQASVSFITNLGHTIYSDDFLQSLDETLARGGADPRLGTRFLEQSLPFREPGFDGALLWDCLQFLPPAWLEAGVERLHAILRPDAVVLAFFNADEKAAAVPCYQYRIADQRTLLLVPRGTRAPAPYFNNRVLERLFQRFATTKFFLTRDHLREVLVKR
jgi:hypothetical protein